MKYLNKKFIRDIMQQWKQFVSVLIMALISVSIYCGMSSVWTGMDESYTDYKEKTNLADAYIDGVNISDEDISNIKKLPYVNQAEGSMFVKFILQNMMKVLRNIEVMILKRMIPVKKLVFPNRKF